MASDLQSVAVDFNTAGSQTLVPAVVGRKIEVYSYALVNGVESGQSVQFKSGGSTNLSGVMQLPLNVGGGVAISASAASGALFRTVESQALTVSSSAATQVGGHLAFKYV